MAVEWVSAIKAIPAIGKALLFVRSVFDSVRGTKPIIDFTVGEYGPMLRIKNTRDESLIIEHAESSPSLLGFSIGDSVRDIAQAVVRQMGHRSENATAVLNPFEEREFIMTAQLNKADPKDTVTVTVFWRMATRSLFSESYAKRKISVRDVRDLQYASDQARHVRVDR